MPTAPASLAICVDTHEDTRSTLWTELLLAREFTTLNAVLGPLGCCAWIVTHHSSPPAISAASVSSEGTSLAGAFLLESTDVVSWRARMYFGSFSKSARSP